MKIIKAVKGEAIVVDDEDFEYLSKFRWWAIRTGRANIYATTFEDGKKFAIKMHHLLMPPPDGMIVDHISGCGLDNRRENLQHKTHQGNSLNRVGNTHLTGAASRGIDPKTEYVGVCKRANETYCAYVGVGGGIQGKQHFIGNFKTSEQAAIARDRVALYLHGSDAHLNFPDRHLEAASIPTIKRELRGLRYKTSGYVGVNKNKTCSGWQAKIRDESGATVYLGSFRTEEEAAFAYDCAALYLGRERWELNLPDEASVPISPHLIRERPVAVRGVCGYLGVRRKRSKFTADIMRDRKLHRLGIFATPEEAARAYDAKARELGETLNLNFPTTVN